MQIISIQLFHHQSYLLIVCISESLLLRPMLPANRSPFNIFYNPRYMGTIVGISDLDPLMWPGSKWRNLQWDETGCGGKQNRVSPWEIKTPESLFIFPSLTTSFKRPLQTGKQTELENLIKKPFIRVPEIINGDLLYPSISSLWSEQLIKMLMKPQSVNNQPAVLDSSAKGPLLQEAKTPTQTMIKQKPQLIPSENISSESKNRPQIHHNQPNFINSNFSDLPRVLQAPEKLGNKSLYGANIEVSKVEPVVAVHQ